MLLRLGVMEPSRRRHLPYRQSLTRRAQSMRSDPTPAERKLWFQYLRTYPQKFTRQKPIARFVVDFYCSSRRLVIELDGDSHFNDAARSYDANRTRELEQMGLRVLRFTNRDVLENFESVCQTVKQILNEP
jgi:very-short-patch-repair endonuclease